MRCAINDGYGMLRGWKGGRWTNLGIDRSKWLHSGLSPCSEWERQMSSLGKEWIASTSFMTPIYRWGRCVTVWDHVFDMQLWSQTTNQIDRWHVLLNNIKSLDEVESVILGPCQGQRTPLQWIPTAVVMLHNLTIFSTLIAVTCSHWEWDSFPMSPSFGARANI